MTDENKSNLFIDTPERLDLMDTLKNIPDSKNALEQLKNITDQYYPGLFVYYLDKYCADYPHLQRNWEAICSHLKTTPKKLILVADIKFEKEYSVVNYIFEILSKLGFVVRRTAEFVPCTVCNAAIPCIELWNQLKNHGIKVPKKWQGVCSTCV